MRSGNIWNVASCNAASLCRLAGLCVPRHCCILLPKRLGGSGQSHFGHEGRDQFPELPAGHLGCGEAAAAVSEAGLVRSRSSDPVCVCVSPGVLLRGHPTLLHPYHPVGHPLEVFLSASCWPNRVVAHRRDYRCLLCAPPFPLVQWQCCVVACPCCSVFLCFCTFICPS